MVEAVTLKVYCDSLTISPQMTAHQIAAVVHRALARAERAAPASVQGSFIPAGDTFSALASIGKVLGQATTDVLIVDPYMDERALTDFALFARESVPVRLLADAKSHKPTLPPAKRKWGTQFGTKRPLEVRLSPPGALHDRVLILDKNTAYLLTQSLNKVAARSPAVITRINDREIAAPKIAAYEAVWVAATPI